MATGSSISKPDNLEDFSLVPPSDIELQDCCIGTKDGKPAAFFSAPDYDRLAAPLKFTLVAKFSTSSSRHSVDVDAFRRHVAEHWGLNELPIISSLDSCLIVIKFQNEADFCLAWRRRETVMDGIPYRLLRWHTDSRFGTESPFLPVWITLEKLPLDFCYPSALKKIAEAFGAEFITADEPTLTQGFEKSIKPSTMQQKGIGPFRKWHDFILQIPPGIDKNVILCCGVLDKLDYDLLECQALVLAPHRHLVEQIAELMQAFGEYLGLNLKVLVSVGGTRFHNSAGFHVVVGTLGRVLHMIREKTLHPDYVKMFVLSEADELLSKSSSQIYDIVHWLPPKIQVGICSSIMLPKTWKFMKNPVSLSFKPEELMQMNVKQFYVDVEKEEWKLEALCDIYESLSIDQCIIFVNTTSKAVWLTDKMRSSHHTVSSVHGGLDCGTIDVTLRKFRSGASRVLIATEFAACYVDVQTVSLVINYDLPTQRKYYLHSIMRANQFGRQGLAINLVTRGDRHMLHDIERFYNIEIEEVPADLL